MSHRNWIEVAIEPNSVSQTHSSNRLTASWHVEGLIGILLHIWLYIMALNLLLKPDIDSIPFVSLSFPSSWYLSDPLDIFATWMKWRNVWTNRGKKKKESKRREETQVISSKNKEREGESPSFYPISFDAIDWFANCLWAQVICHPEKEEEMKETASS